MLFLAEQRVGMNQERRYSLTDRKSPSQWASHAAGLVPAVVGGYFV